MIFYFYGHGFQLEPGPHWPTTEAVDTTFDRDPATFVLPEDVRVHFYVQDGVSFDTAVERYLFTGEKGPKPKVVDDIFYRESFPTPNSNDRLCPNLVLTRPGTMDTMVPETAVKAIVPTPNTPRGDHQCTILQQGLPLNNLDTLAVKQGKKMGNVDERHLLCYTYLNAIVAAIRPLVQGPLDLHWLACRDYQLLVDHDGSLLRDEILPQAQGNWKTLPGPWGNNPPRQIVV